ncbi:MAG: saccharopine dehydrogenase family protein [Legionellales bacterium]|nr:saccharopine dehydrogenase family protein [Legionellales bacterium]
MHKIMVIGAGKIGSLIACLFNQTNDYQVYLVDQQFTGADVARLLAEQATLTTLTLDVRQQTEVVKVIRQQNIDALVSCLPYYVNNHVAEIAKIANVAYFDLTEDIQVTQRIMQLADQATQAFVPQCGLAPGFVSIASQALMQRFDQIDIVKLRVGALPQHTHNTLHYALTWSTEGLINQYGNACYAIVEGELTQVRPLESLEAIKLDGQTYEAFNTSGGLGSLATSYAGKVKYLNYKTLRYPGHCEKMRVLMNDLRLNEDRKTLQQILEHAVPKTYQDVVIIYVSVTGQQNGVLVEEDYVKKIYPQTIANMHWSAIQVSTAAGVCTIVDLVLAQPERYAGFVLQEDFALTDFLANRFASYYQ